MKRILNISSADSNGGAGIAARRIHESMLDLSMDSKLLTKQATSTRQAFSINKNKFSKLMSEIIPSLNAQSVRRYKRQGLTFSSSSISSFSLANEPLVEWADVIILYWVAGGLLKLNSLKKIDKRILWRLSDIWPFTGGCHYSYTCTKFQTVCGSCEQLGSATEKDLAYRNFKHKQTAYRDLSMEIVAPSRWIQQQAEMSSLFGNKHIHYLPTGVDTNIFKPIDKQIARTLFGLPLDKKIILCSYTEKDSDIRKGGKFLFSVLTELAKINNEIFIVNLGTKESLKCGLESVSVGKLVDEIALALIYSSADLTLFPTTADNLPNFLLESMACGTPAVASAVGGVPELVINNKTGSALPLHDTNLWAQQIIKILTDDNYRLTLSKNCRQHIENNYDLIDSALRWKELIG